MKKDKNGSMSHVQIKWISNELVYFEVYGASNQNESYLHHKA